MVVRISRSALEAKLRRFEHWMIYRNNGMDPFAHVDNKTLFRALNQIRLSLNVLQGVSTHTAISQ